MKMQQCLCQASHWQLIPSEFCFALSHFPLLLPTSETSEWKWNTMKIYSKQDKKFLITLELDLTELSTFPPSAYNFEVWNWLLSVLCGPGLVKFACYCMLFLEVCFSAQKELSLTAPIGFGILFSSIPSALAITF